MKERYQSEVTDESLRELLAIAEWYDKRYGHSITVVGGWAAYLYHHGLGSRDIDLIFLHPATLRKSLEEYMRHNGYALERDEKQQWVFVKRVGGAEIEVDAVDSIARPLVTGTNAHVIWRWAHGKAFVAEYKLENGAKIFIPKPELLLYYKLGAILGRRNMLTQTVDPTEAARLQAKIQKDVYDAGKVAENSYANTERLWLFMKASGLMRHAAGPKSIRATLDEFSKNEEVGGVVPRLLEILNEAEERDRNFDALVHNFVHGGNESLLETLPLYRPDFPEIYYAAIDKIMKEMRTTAELKYVVRYLNCVNTIIGNSKDLAEHARRHLLQIKDLCGNKNADIHDAAKRLFGVLAPPEPG